MIVVERTRLASNAKVGAWRRQTRGQDLRSGAAPLGPPFARLTATGRLLRRRSPQKRRPQLLTAPRVRTIGGCGVASSSARGNCGAPRRRCCGAPAPGPARSERVVLCVSFYDHNCVESQNQASARSEQVRSSGAHNTSLIGGASPGEPESSAESSISRTRPLLAGGARSSLPALSGTECVTVPFTGYGPIHY